MHHGVVKYDAQARTKDYVGGSLGDLGSPVYGGKLRVVFGGDKGGKVMRWVVEVAAGRTHLVGLYSAHDHHANLEVFLVSGFNWIEQIRCATMELMLGMQLV